MKITKYTHACLLVESDDHAVLFDPGQFSWEAGRFPLDSLEWLDAIVITHEHFDHCHVPFVRAVTAKFPKVCIISTPDVVAQLKTAGVTQAGCQSTAAIKVFSDKRHANLDPLGQAPQNIAVHLHDQLTVGGDRHDLEESKAILALTVTAPWGAMLDAVRMAVRLKPKYIVPVHDWHWNSAARQQAYDNLAQFFAGQGITFYKPVDGEPFEITP